ncbi:hypothetical protein DAEQUDRAFT_765761 [Daedalea quercina L-15889]|uniref:Zn(2)-C6 fungal-type domain-containing protein n=1 Tax=Daedalea quercina L-15889 TaxID=1314783 RepID=A0A165Q3Q5_9APHY|nr:hypothetical protein DAEQUDRAFT_765761 [Daedalea quercina L-15889]
MPIMHRRKKKKCDAKRPYCTTCEVAGKQHECLYEENIQRHLTETLIARTRELETRLAVYESQSPSPETGNTIQTDDIFSLPEASSSAFPFTPDDINIFDLTSPGGTSYTLTLPDQSMFPEGGNSSSMASSSSSVPVSLQELSDYRATFLAHHGQLGVSLTEPKMQALLNGDLSGSYIHPVLIYAAQTIGCRFWQLRHRTVLNSSVESALLQFVEKAMLEAPPPIARLQVHCILSIYFLLKRQMREGREQLMKAAQITLHNNLRFDTHIAETLTTLENTTDEAQEAICALSQLMYLDKASAMVLNDPSLLTPDYDQQFHTLPYMFPNLSKTNLVVLRARSLALLQESRRLAAKWTEIILNIGAFDPQATINDQTKWYDDYWELLEDVLEHNATLTVSTLKTSFNGNSEMALTLKMCTIVSLTAAAELHRLLAGHHLDSRSKCLNTALEIVNITKELRDDDYHFLDPVLGTCWSMVAAMLDQERPHMEDNAQLKSSFHVILNSANKLGHALPYVEHSLETINNVMPNTCDGNLIQNF